MLMPNRSYTAGNQFRYGFNGKENDNDVKGTGNQQDYGMRIYDTRIGKFLSVDPLMKNFPWYTPYQFAGNSPICKIDLDGGEPKDFRENWIPKPLFVLNTKQLIGREIYITDPKLGKTIDVEIIYDAWTKQVWFVHQDDQGNWFYLKNDNGINSEMSIDPKTNTLKGGAFVSFKTQNQLQGQYMRELTDGTSAVVAGIIASIAGGIAVDGLASTYGTSTVVDIVADEIKDEIIDQAKESIGIPDVGLDLKDVKSIVKEGKDVLKNQGRKGAQEKLRNLASDAKTSTSDRGWIKQEINQINRGKRSSIRNPPGKVLAHERGRESAKGYSYKYSKLQDQDLHKLQHRYDNNGKLNKERPIKD